MQKTILSLMSTVTILNCLSGQIKENKIKTKKEIQISARQFKGEKNSPKTYQTIFIHSFHNRSLRGILSSRLKEKLEIAYNTDGKLQVSSDKKAAGVWLYGDILRYQKIPLRFNQLNQVVTYRLEVIVSIKVILNPYYGDRILLARRDIRYDIYYDPLEIPYVSEFSANERLLDGLVDRIIYISLEGWELKSEERSNQKKNSDLIDKK